MIRFNDPHAIKLISAGCKVPFAYGLNQCIARYSSRDILLGGVFYTDYNVASVHAHVCSFRPNWLNKELLWMMFDYPFNSLKVKKVILPIPQHNEKSLAFAHHLGFSIETRVKDVFPTGDMLVLGMYREDCIYLKMKRPESFDGKDGYAQAG